MTPEPEAELVDVDARTVVAAVGEITKDNTIQQLFPKLLDRVWAHIRGTDVEGADHNVLIYRNHGTELTAGVRVPDDTSAPPAPLILTATPSGRVAHLRHVGSYTGLPASVEALFAWCADNGIEVAEPSWEVYGDWEEDESKLVTDIYVVAANR